MSGQASRIEVILLFGFSMPVGFEETNNLSPFSPEPAHVGAEGPIPNRDTFVIQALTDTFQGMSGF
jgi:hypothetical protein